MDVMIKEFSVKQALKYGFSQFFEHAGVIFGAMLVGISIAVGLFVGMAAVIGLVVYLMIGYDFSLITHFSSMSREAIAVYVNSLFSSLALPAIILIFVIFIAYMWYVYSLYLGFIRILFDIYEFNSSSVSRLFSCRSIALKAWVVQCIFSFIVMIGFLLLFVPGLFVFALYGFAKFCLIDRGGRIFESFSYSSKLARGAIMKLLAYYVAIAVISPLSMIFPPLLLIVYPSLLLSSVFVYKKLQEQTA